MTFEIAFVLGVIAVAIVLFIWEKLSIDTIAMLIMLAFVVSGILTPEEGFSGFTNSATITVAAMFVLSAAIFRAGALSHVGGILTTVGKKSYTLFLLVLMSSAGVLSAFINDTAVVALLMPVVMQVSRDTKISPAKMLMPLSFGALLGGICTLLGTSTNILVSGIAEANGLEPFGIFELTRGGIWFLVAGIIYIVAVGQFLLPKRKVEQDLTDTFDLGSYLTEIILQADSPSVGKRLNESPIGTDENLQVIQITRNGRTLRLDVSTELLEGDELKIVCDLPSMEKLQHRKGAIMSAAKKVNDINLADDRYKLYEVMIPSTSSFVDRSLSQLRFKNHYDALVIAIRSREGTHHERLSKVVLQQGDVLLIKADPTQMLELKESEDVLLLSEYQPEKYNFKHMIPTLLIALAIVVVAATGLAPITLAAVLGVVLLILIRTITPEEAYKAVHWKVIFMLAGVLSMGLALQKTGADKLLAENMVNLLGSYGPHVMLSAFFGVTFLLTNFMSNNATAALLAPIAIVTAQAIDVDPRPFLMAVTFAASMAFMTPMGYQTNAMIYGPGNYRFKDYVIIGTPLTIIMWLLATFIIPWMYPF